jgi:hypothetical protein
MSKFATADQDYLTQRTGQADWKTVDAWPLYCGIQNLGRYWFLGEQLRQTLMVPGHVVEFGTWRGATCLLFAKLLQLWDPDGMKVVHGFDRWAAGFEAQQWRPEDNQAAIPQYAGTYVGELGVIRDMLTLYGLQDAVELHQGLVEETWPALLAAHPEFRVSLALCDVDLYEPTKVALTGLHERLSPGGVILFDEWGYADWPGETQAAEEFLAAHPGAYDVVATPTRQPSLLLRKR